ncbi:RadC family protein [Aquabacterium sp.]|uniref:RadC family protein n=1 Tax=Aquabacterium sp. TaxID=1872578 RepID=UPI002E30CECD|nr:DNA repair protein RadC [Aquabacterium sp.]HEX5310204.1 DNA repair protein RadC [Aquabacterium sp.]
MKDIPTALRPREKLQTLGPTALADAELLALLLRTGMKGLSVLQLAEKVLVDLGGLPGLLQADARMLGRIKGLGPAKCAELVAVMELARRSLQHGLQSQPVFGNPQGVKDFLQMQLGHRPHEVFGVLYLDAQHRLIAFEELFRGTLTQTSVYPREVVKQALAHNAGAVILTHNHPSGVLEPSRADELLTQTLKSSLQLVDVRVLDHIVVGRSACLSFAERGLL